MPPRLTSLADREKATEPTDFSVSPEQWGNFLCALFGVMQKRAPANVMEAIRKKNFKNNKKAEVINFCLFYHHFANFTIHKSLLLLTFILYFLL